MPAGDVATKKPTVPASIGLKVAAIIGPRVPVKGHPGDFVDNVLLESEAYGVQIGAKSEIVTDRSPPAR